MTLEARRARGSVLAGVALLFFGVPGVQGQTVLARVLDDEGGGPITGALVHLVDGSGTDLRAQLTDGIGRALFVGVDAGTYTLRVDMIGRATTSSPAITVTDGAPVQLDIRLSSSAIALEGIEVRAEERCRVRPEEGLEISRVWDEARKALEAASFTDRAGLYRYETEIYERDLDGNGRFVLREESSSRVAYLRVPFESLPAERLMAEGFLHPEEGGGTMYYAPDAEVLLSDIFLDTHCLALREGEGEAEGLIGVGFEPAPGRSRDVVDIRGVLWVDPTSSELRWIDYRYVNLPAGIDTGLVGGFVEFRRMPDGTWIVPEWWIRMPMLSRGPDFTGRFVTRVDGYRQTGGRVSEVRGTGGDALMRGQTAEIEGFVQDSSGVTPYPGIRVGLEGASQMVFTDAEGRFRIGGLTDGAYRLRFVDPHLEALGLEAEPLETTVRRGEVSTVYFRMPSVSELAFEACRSEAAGEGLAMVAGRVTDGTGQRGLAGITVRLTWEDFRITPLPGGGAISTDATGLAAETDARGRYRICGVPENRLLYPTLEREGRTVRGDTTRVAPLERAHAVDLVWEP